MKDKNWREEIAPMPTELTDWLQNNTKCLGSGDLSRCFLCGDKSFVTALFDAGEKYSSVLGAAPGKTRIVVYGLCSACADREDSPDRVEDKLFSQHASFPNTLQ